ncbi:CopG family transcriptional regulator [Paenibacillus sp. 1011MAR3C5]|uniref:ribbon-helix-helix domain-containing protein n=1 Tax=Paenibacillus sp. 1011MAR3C5 TaxID=1675787 RepID=UPI000E6BF739|nr:ribbon-helix-helix domain-containing protein [Paenibacillus sp. 1011MAR3C5]RJE91386.1 CopG family transcriptional regulator [Paenibacillus sp. 1011MAR3C5]
MNPKKPGRPTDSVKDNILKLRIDSDTLDKLDELAEERQTSRSEIIRNVIPVISSKDFESMITLDNLQRLEKYSNQCVEYFQQANFKLKLQDVQANFPAFVSAGEPPVLNIKKPTYKIKILLFGNTVAERVQELLKDVSGISRVYLTPSAVFNNNQMSMEFLPEVMCLQTTLSDNIVLKDAVCDILSRNQILFEIWPAYSITGQTVRIINENNDSYVVPV